MSWTEDRASRERPFPSPEIYEAMRYRARIKRGLVRGDGENRGSTGKEELTLALSSGRQAGEYLV